MRAIIIGAGRGRRLMPTTENAPKCFAEIQGKKPGKRQFDVIVNGTPFLIAFDISALAGENNALDRSLFVSVPASGEVTVQLAERQAHGEPLLNAVRVTHRPDH